MAGRRPGGGVLLRAGVRAMVFGPTPKPSPDIAAAPDVVLISIIAAVYFLLTAIRQDRDFFPKTHDECSYAIQVRQLAIGRLWLPPHPLADFFDSFYLLARPVYASMYFPGTAMLNVPGAWLHAPTWLIPLFIAATVVGLTFTIVCELTDGLGGVIAVILVVSLSWFRMHSMMLMSQLPLLLFGLLAFWAWLRWRHDGRWGWLLLIGITCGWAAITRPLDAICFAVPVGVAIVTKLRSKPRKLAIAIGLIAAGLRRSWQSKRFVMSASRGIYCGRRSMFMRPRIFPALPTVSTPWCRMPRWSRRSCRSRFSTRSGQSLTSPVIRRAGFWRIGGLGGYRCW